MNAIKQTLNIAWKDFQILIRDRGMLAVIIAMPLLFGLLLSTAYSSSYTNSSGSGIKIGIYVVNEDAGRYGSNVVDFLKQVDVLEITELNGTNGSEQANNGILAGEKTAAIFIPSDLSAKIDDYSGSEVTLMIDPQKKDFAPILKGILNYALAPVVVEGEIRHGVRSVLEKGGALAKLSPEMQTGIEAQTIGVVMTRLQAMMSAPLIATSLISGAKDPDMPINFFNLLMPGFTVMFSFFMVGGVGESIFREQDEGTFRRLLAGPIPRIAIIAGKMLAFALVIILQVGVLFGISAGAFSMDLGSSPLALILVTISLSLVVTSMGLMVASLTKSGKQADSISTLMAFVLAGLGGCIQFGLTPLFLQDNFIATISRFTPQGQALWGYYKIINQAAGVKDILLQVGILLGMALLFSLIASWRLKWAPK